MKSGMANHVWREKFKWIKALVRELGNTIIVSSVPTLGNANLNQAEME